MRAEYKGYLWSYDFVMDRPDDGCRLKMLLLVHEEHTREYLYIGVERSFTAQSVVKVLTTLFEERGEPALIRSDNGPEFIVRAVRRWLVVCGVKTLYIDLGSLWENAYAESFIGRFGDE